MNRKTVTFRIHSYSDRIVFECMESDSFNVTVQSTAQVFETMCKLTDLFYVFNITVTYFPFAEV